MSKTTTLSPEKIELFRKILIHQADLDPKFTGQVYLACPIHGDLTSDSFSANLDDATWTCHGKCDTYGGLKELQGHLLKALRQQEPDHCFDYVDENGALLYQICRWDDFPVPGKKEFMTRRPNGRGWTWGLGDTQKVLYRLPEVLAAGSVFIVEGEKCADRLASALALRADGEEEVEEGSIAMTTHPFGANKTAWLPEYSETLRGKTAVILPDNDEVGRQHAQRVAKALHGIAASVRLVKLPELPEKGYIVDWLDAGHVIGELMDLIEETPELTGEDLGAWEDTEQTSTANDRRAPSDLEKLAGLAMRHDVFQDADTVARLLQLDTLEQYGLIMLMQQKNSRFDVGRFWRMVEMAAINKTMPPLLTGADIKALSETPPPPRVIEKLFLRGGFTIVGADPKCGKSTLIRNAMAAVLEGGEFLGRKCTTGPVLYYAVEGDPAENSKHLCQLLANPDNINHLSMRAGAISPSFFIRTLRQDIQNTGAIFVVIDPLVDILGLTDINDYVNVNRMIKPVVTVAQETGCHIVALHHNNKGRHGGNAKSFLGSAQLPGSTDCNIMLYKTGEERYIRSEQRYSYDEPILESKLSYDKESGRVWLGETSKPGEAKAAGRQDAILQVLRNLEPGKWCSQNQLYKLSGGGNREVFKQDLGPLQALILG